ncbi:MAG: M48 family metalloprotease [Bacteroidota bacterium]
MLKNPFLNGSVILVLTSILWMISSCAVNPVTGKKQLMLMSESQEIALGKQSDPAIVAQFGLYQDEEIQKFIDEKGQQMAAISHRPNLPWEFKVVDSPVINAFAVPGGYVYFTRGILAHFNNEAEFAGVLGHEIGHVTARHSAQQYSKMMAAQVGFVVGMVASKELRQYADVAGAGLQLLQLKFGRDHESQSDRLGVEYSTKIGYDAHHMANFFNTLKRMRQSSGAEPIPTFMSTHPDPGDRFNKVHQHAEEWQQGVDPSTLAVNRDSYLDMIDGIVFGEDPRQGYVYNNKFYHPDLKFQFPVPANWNTLNMPTAVQIGAPDQKGLIIMTLAQGSSLQQVANDIIAKDSLKVIETRNINVHGNSAIAFLADLDQDPQNVLRILTYLIQYDGLIYKFHGLSKVADYPRFNTEFVRTMGEFRRLTDPSKINVKPNRVKVMTVPYDARLTDALKALGAQTNEDLEEWSILNSMLLDDPVKKGMKIKIVEKNFTLGR